jgi:hypothetical protein
MTPSWLTLIGDITPPADSWFKLLGELAFPAICLAFLAWCLVKVARWFVRKDGPWDRLCGVVKRVVDTHLGFVESAQKLGEQQIGLQTKVIDLQTGHNEDSRKAWAAIRNMRNAGCVACDLLDTILADPGYSEEVREAAKQIRHELEKDG